MCVNDESCVGLSGGNFHVLKIPDSGLVTPGVDSLGNSPDNCD